MANCRTEPVETLVADNRVCILYVARLLVSSRGSVRRRRSRGFSRGSRGGQCSQVFPSKADLFAEVVRTVSQREADVLREIADSGGSASERLAAAVRAFASRAIRGRRLAYAVIAEPVDPEVDDARLEYRRILCGAIERIIRDGIEHGEFPPRRSRPARRAWWAPSSKDSWGPLRWKALPARQTAPASSTPSSGSRGAPYRAWSNPVPKSTNGDQEEWPWIER